MIALLVALSLATPASHGHRSVHAHAHKHKHRSAHSKRAAQTNPCISDAQQVRALEVRIGNAGVSAAELNKLQNQLESAIERARQACGS